MNFLPNEILYQVFGYLDSQTLQNARCVSSHWWTISTLNFKNRYNGTVNFDTIENLEDFCAGFSNCVDFMLKRFRFSEDLVVSPLMHKFAEKHGQFVTCLKISYHFRTVKLQGLCPQQRSEKVHQYPECDYASNLHFLLSETINLEHLILETSYPFEEIGILSSQLPNLKTIKVMYSSLLPKPLFLAELSIIPNLLKFQFEEQNFVSIINVLHNLSQCSPHVLTTHENLDLDITRPDPTFLKQILETRVQFENLAIKFGIGSHGEAGLEDFWTHFSNWMELQTGSLRKLKLSLQCHDAVPLMVKSPFSMLEEFELLSTTPLDSDNVLQFPNLRILKVHSEMFSTFSDCKLESVEILHLTTSEKMSSFQPWHCIVPNITTLRIHLLLPGHWGSAKNMQMAFRFDGLKHLEISNFNALFVSDWHVFTGGEPNLSDSALFALPENCVNYLPIQYPCLKNLKNLETLTVYHLSLHGLRALLYLSKTRQIPRLKRICIPPKPYENLEDRQLYMDSLCYFHTVVTSKPNER